MNLRLLVLSIVSGVSLSAFGASQINLLCERTPDVDCAARVNLALEQMDCKPIAESVKCRAAQSVAGNDFCEVSSLNCSEPRMGLFISTSCDIGSKVSFKKIDKGLTLTWWMGFGPYLRDLCKN
jgi:hypothetical protein